jgi:cytochrome c peroxidase
LKLNAVIGLTGVFGAGGQLQSLGIGALRGVFTRQPGGFFHDGRFATVNDVVAHFNTEFNLELTEEQARDLAELLKSL